MKRAKNDLLLIVCGIASLLAVFVLPFFKPLPVQVVPESVIAWFDDVASQYSLMFVSRQQKTAPAVAVAVDEESMRRFDQRWPLSRSLYARLVRELNAEGAKVIAFDLFFQGQSADPANDRELADALCASKAATVIGYTYDFKTSTVQLPPEQVRRCAGMLGWLYAPQDADNAIRRSRVIFKAADESVHFAFSAAMAAAYLDMPLRELLGRTTVSPDGTFRISYLLRPQSSSIPVVSLAELLEDRGALKRRFGNDFLRDKLCLVYPAADINHDRYATPAGTLDGGWIQLNAAWNMISGRTVTDVPLFTVLLVLVSFALTAFILRAMDVSDRVGLSIALLFVGALIFLVGFWAQVSLAGLGMRYEYGRVSVFTLLFFISGWLIQQVSFLKQLVAIKDKVALDPLHHLYTPRYFLYRLDVEMKRRVFGRSLYLVSVFLDGLQNELRELDLDQTRTFWQRFSAILEAEGGFWCAYAPDLAVGGLHLGAAAVEPCLRRIEISLQTLLRERGLGAKTRICACLMKKEYPAEQMVQIVTGICRGRSEARFMVRESDFSAQLLSVYADVAGQQFFVDSLADDIEEKNRELLSLVSQLKKEQEHTREAFFQIISSLVNALEARDPYTQGHAQRVADYSLLLAADLGWPRDRLEQLRRAALLHDIGKIGIPDSILHKPASLTNEEFDFIKKHEIFAVNILKPLKDFEEILPWILYHHERWDGKGYPHGLAGAAIPQASQIISLADVYDALTTGRDYKKALVPEDTLRILREGKNVQFDPELTERFIAVITRRQPEK